MDTLSLLTSVLVSYFRFIQSFARRCRFLFVYLFFAAKKLASGKTYTFCGTPNFVAPEVILQRGHDGAADNWSLGVLVFEMIDGDNPFWEEGMDNATLYDVICNSPYFPLPEHISEAAEHLISRLLEKNPSKRIGTFREKDILEHEWFARVDMEKLRTKQVKAPKLPDPIKLGP
jgi:serine/threonine protein kinase